MAAFTSTLLGSAIGGLASAGVGAVAKAIAGGNNKEQKMLPVTQYGNATQGLVMPTSGEDAQHAAGTTQNALAEQQNLVMALQAQQGIRNQSSVYGQQQALANQLGLMAQGQGPSIAQTQLANTTGQNVSNQAALMAGQRGSGANAGLMARQIGQQGAGIQQQAAGQAAQLRAQEQLNAISALQQQQNMLGGLSTQQVGQQANATSAYNSAAQNNQGQVLNALQGQNSILSGQQQAANANATKLQAQDNEALYKGAAGLASGIGTSLLTPPAAADNGGRERTPTDIGPSRQNGKFANGGQVTIQKENYKGKSRLGLHLSSGGVVPAMVSPGEIYLSPEQATKVAQGKMSPMQGQRIPGTPKVQGDSQKNDTVSAMLEAGGVVIKRTKAQDEEAARKFVQAVKARKK